MKKKEKKNVSYIKEDTFWSRCTLSLCLICLHDVIMAYSVLYIIERLERPADARRLTLSYITRLLLLSDVAPVLLLLPGPSDEIHHRVVGAHGRII